MSTRTTWSIWRYAFRKLLGNYRKRKLQKNASWNKAVACSVRPGLSQVGF